MEGLLDRSILSEGRRVLGGFVVHSMRSEVFCALDAFVANMSQRTGGECINSVARSPFWLC
jgi:hypothetical protein